MALVNVLVISFEMNTVCPFQMCGNSHGLMSSCAVLPGVSGLWSAGSSLHHLRISFRNHFGTTAKSTYGSFRICVSWDHNKFVCAITTCGAYCGAFSRT